jgi:hypothetical protein
MRIGSAFPSDYLKSDDLNGREVLVTIKDCKMQELGQGKDKEEKAVLYFQGKEKGMVLNKTNAGVLSDAFGDETDDWKGEEVILFAKEVEFQGKPTMGLRIKLPSRKKGGAARERDPGQDDEIPF